MSIPYAVRSWELAAAVFFAYVLLAAAVPAAARARNRAGAANLALTGLGLTLLSILLPPNTVLHEWLLPPALLLLGYWSSGWLFRSPMPAAERVLAGVDRALGVRSMAARLGRGWSEALELAYAGVYVLVPIALLVHLGFSPAPDPERFWAVILVTDYVCFAPLPWLQTRPPRSLEADEPWASGLRRLNRRLVDAASIQANTCPSGHAAEALAAVLLVLDAPLPLVLATAVAALAVSAGAVFGRYHYALDVFAGWAVALLVWRVL